jgi:hypothetical protein
MITKGIPFEIVFKTLKLKEHTLYKVKAQSNENNPKHTAFLFVGFKSGGYCTVYTNNYEQPMDFNKVYSIQITKKLTKIKTY